MSEPWKASEVGPHRHWHLASPDGRLFNFGTSEDLAREAAASLNALAGMNPEKLGELIDAARNLLNELYYLATVDGFPGFICKECGHAMREDEQHNPGCHTGLFATALAALRETEA